jgi:hypothetical protein
MELTNTIVSYIAHDLTTEPEVYIAIRPDFILARNNANTFWSDIGTWAYYSKASSWVGDATASAGEL